MHSQVVYSVYIMGNDRPTLYVGMTNELMKRVYQHKEGLVEGFTKQYHLKKLLYFENYEQVMNAIVREKQLKHWKREWKLDLIKSINPSFRDLYEDLTK